MHTTWCRAWAWLLTILSISGSCTAVQFINLSFDVQPGSPFTLAWAENVGSVTLTLLRGGPASTTTVAVLASDIPGNSFTWTPPDGLVSDFYSFQIVDQTGIPNYSIEWQFIAATSSSSISSPSGTTTSTASSSGTTTSTASPPSSGLSTGAKAGIGVAVTIVVLSLLGACAIFFYRRGKAGARSNDVPHVADPWLKPELEGKGLVEMSTESETPELGGKGLVEMSTESETPELGGKGLVEMSTGLEAHEIGVGNTYPRAAELSSEPVGGAKVPVSPVEKG